MAGSASGSTTWSGYAGWSATDDAAGWSREGVRSYRCEMTEEFSTYLERVRAHRGELGEAMRALDDALALPVGLGALWRRRVRAALTELEPDLRDHGEVPDAPGGLEEDCLFYTSRCV